ncbi:Uncharacterized protein Fot_33834 [Forsythia ovata]|uniref:Uncharacterized protein n=1 Tax=Forsythia ovata TaxID=205694 RepID=A0ABD1TBU7_9LAMI
MSRLWADVESFLGNSTNSFLKWIMSSSGLIASYQTMILHPPPQPRLALLPADKSRNPPIIAKHKTLKSLVLTDADGQGCVVYEQRAVGGAEGEANVRLLSFQKDSGSSLEYALMVCTTFGIAQWDGTERSDLSGHQA